MDWAMAPIRLWTTGRAKPLAASGLSGTDFQLDVEMRNNADTERLRLEQAKVTGVAEPRTVITEATFNELNQLVSRGGGGETLFSGTTDEPATVTVDGTDAILGNGGQSFAATVDLPTGTSTVTVEATDVNSNTTSEDYEVEVAAGSGQSLTYDANGNMTDNGSGQTYKWDAENSLIEITRGSRDDRIRLRRDEPEDTDHREKQRGHRGGSPLHLGRSGDC